MPAQKAFLGLLAKMDEEIVSAVFVKCPIHPGCSCELCFASPTLLSTSVNVCVELLLTVPLFGASQFIFETKVLCVSNFQINYKILSWPCLPLTNFQCCTCLLVLWHCYVSLWFYLWYSNHFLEGAKPTKSVTLFCFWMSCGIIFCSLLCYCLWFQLFVQFVCFSVSLESLISKFHHCSGALTW